MGEVYLAEDTRLHRNVALKILPEDVASNRDRMRRFEQEATAAAALNHPNIAHIYEIGNERPSLTADSHPAEVHFISMEYVEGETLRSCIYQKDTDLRKLLRYLQHVAEGLAKAHAAGIVHRDIKPDNLMVTREGHAKILDFGLAKLLEPLDTSMTGTHSREVPTALQPKQSVPGAVMGTVGYMSPEQAQGKVDEIDQRSDVFSFGCVLFEAITRHHPFEAESPIESLHKVVYEPAPLLKTFNPTAPGDLQRIVRRCLAKDKEDRYQTIKDVALELKDVRHEMDATVGIHAADSSTESSGTPITGNGGHKTAGVISATQPGVSRVTSIVTDVTRHKAGALLGVLLAALAVGTLAYRFWPGQKPTRRSATLRVSPFTSFPGNKGQPVFSWDGKKIAFTWDGENNDNPDIYVKLVGEGAPLRLTTDPLPDIQPAWSPDGSHIAFIRVTPAERLLITVPSLGGVERTLFASPDLRQSDWSPDGKYLAVADSETAGDLTSIYLVSTENGARKRLTQAPPQFNGDREPKFSPDGEWVAFIRSTNFAVEDVYIIAVGGGEPTRLTHDGRELSGLDWTADGREIVFSSKRGGNYGLWRVAVAGGPPEILPGAGDNARQPTVSRQGNYLAYLFDGSDTNIWRAPGPNAENKTLAPVKLIESTRNEGSPRYSADGRRIAFASDRTGGTEVWVCDSEGHNSIQLTQFRGHAGAARWSPDGKELVLDARPEGSSDIYVVGADGGSPRRLTYEPSADVLPVWSSDGKWIYFGSDRSGDWRIWRMPAAGGPAEPITKGAGYGPLAADDRFLYYTRSSGVPARRTNDPGVWRIPIDGGDEIRVVDQGLPGTLAVISDGIANFAMQTKPNPTINFYRFATREWTTLLSVERSAAFAFGGRLSVSPDGQWIIYSRQDQTVNDIMLVENFY
jgi:eukaryotic-like serine/threonine-protein kinase